MGVKFDRSLQGKNEVLIRTFESKRETEREKVEITTQVGVSFFVLFSNMVRAT